MKFVFVLFIALCVSAIAQEFNGGVSCEVPQVENGTRKEESIREKKERKRRFRKIRKKNEKIEDIRKKEKRGISTKND